MAIGCILIFPEIISDADAIDVLLTGDFLLLFLFFIRLYVADILNVGKTQNDHQIVDEFYFNAVVEQNRGILDLLGKSVAVGFDNAL